MIRSLFNNIFSTSKKKSSNILEKYSSTYIERIYKTPYIFMYIYVRDEKRQGTTATTARRSSSSLRVTLQRDSGEAWGSAEGEGGGEGNDAERQNA